MIGIFLICSLLIVIFLGINRNTVVNYSLVVAYGVLLLFFAGFEAFNSGVSGMVYFRVDSLGIIFLFALCVVSVPAFYHGYRYIATHDETPHSRGLFFAAMVMLMSSCSMAYLSDHIAVTWIFAELTTLSASALIYHHRNIRALEGVWKYVFICAISITFIYIGILFLSLSGKQAGIDDLSFTSLMENAGMLDKFWLKLAFLFIFTGFTAKIGLVPMYTAGIDAKDKAPAPAGALFSSVLMNMGFIGIYRLYAIISMTPLKEWASLIMLISGVLSVFVATVYMTHIKNIKRMFAYSSIEHMGLVVLGLALGGVGVYAAILHLLLHTFVKPALFFQYNQIYRVYQSKSIYDSGNYIRYNRAGAIVIFLAFISATAMPPSGLFVSEFMIFQSLFGGRHYVLMVLILIMLTLILWGFGSNIFRLLFTKPVFINESNLPQIKAGESLSQYLLILISVYIAYNPPQVLVKLIEDAAGLIS